MTPSPPDPNWGQAVSVQSGNGHRATLWGDRWSIHRRLQELNIPANCPSDGTLRVDVNYPLALLLVRSVILKFSLPRQESVDWLERCWQSQVLCAANS